MTARLLILELNNKDYFRGKLSAKIYPHMMVGIVKKAFLELNKEYVY